MRLNCFCLALALIFTACWSCSRPRTANNASENKPLETTRNAKYGLSIVFYGAPPLEPIEETPVIVRYIGVRDEATGKEAQYTPPDIGSIQPSQGRYPHLWSPNEEYLVVPLDRFKGFCIIKSSLAVEAVSKGECSDRVKVFADNDTGLWHDFDKWSDRETFAFRAGLSGDYFGFQYDISNGKLTYLTQGTRGFVGENAEGRLEIR